MDRQDLIGEVVKRTGIRIDANDPAFVVVHLAELVLKDHTSEVTADLRTAARQISEEFSTVLESLQAGQTMARKATGATVDHLEDIAKRLDHTSEKLLQAALALELMEKTRSSNAERNATTLKTTIEAAVKAAIPPPQRVKEQQSKPPSTWVIATCSLQALTLVGIAILWLFR